MLHSLKHMVRCSERMREELDWQVYRRFGLRQLRQWLVLRYRVYGYREFRRPDCVVPVDRFRFHLHRL